MRGAAADTGDGTVETERDICQEKDDTLIERDTGDVRKSDVQQEDRKGWRILTGAVLARREAYHPKSWKLLRWSILMMKLSYCPDAYRVRQEATITIVL